MLPFSNGVIIDYDFNNEVADMVEEMTKKNVLNKHPYAITETVRRGQECFITYVYDESKPNKRKQISANTMENLENKIYDDFKQKMSLTFERVAYECMQDFKEISKPTTFARTMTDYNKFIIGSDLAKKDIRKIKRNDLKRFFQNAIKKYNLLDRAYKNLRCLINKVFKYAIDAEYITINPMDNLDISKANIQPEKKKTKEEVVYTNKERDMIREYIVSDKGNYKNTVPYAILLSFQLGLRVSELIALKWSDISNGKIHIQRQEIIYDEYDINLNKVKKSIHKIVEYTKTKDGDRFLPLTPEAIKILDSVKEWNKQHNLTSEFIFIDENNQHYNRQRINTKLYKYCEQVGITKKSSHKIRRCVISNLLDNIINKKSVQEFAGHSDLQTTLNSYYKDVSDDNEFYSGMCACL